jgi:hypothetical protein
MSLLPEPEQQAKHPVSVLAGPYGHPFHPILVTVPIGAWTAGLVFDIASHVTTGNGFLAQGSLWLIAVGIACALAAACAGFLDLFAIPMGTTAFRTALRRVPGPARRVRVSRRQARLPLRRPGRRRGHAGQRLHPPRSSSATSCSPRPG